jgi:hypothetical protein
MIDQFADYYFSYAMYAYVGFYITVIAMLLRKPLGPLAGNKWLLILAITFAFGNIVGRALLPLFKPFPLIVKQSLWMVSTCSELAAMVLFILYCNNMNKVK